MSVESFTPPVPAHATRIAALLNEYYPARNADDCRAALAAMYGHADWRALEAAMQGVQEASRFDEDVEPQVAQARIERQYEIALHRLAGMTDAVMITAQELDQELLSASHASIARRHDPHFNEKRMQRARYAFEILYARQVIGELRPTGRNRSEIPADEDDITLGMRVDLVPRALEAWLVHHRPLLSAAGREVGKRPVRQRSTTDLIRFAFRWGELCLFHAIDIPQALQIYPIALCSKWYGWAAATARVDLEAAFTTLHSGTATRDDAAAAERLIDQALHEEEARFILTQPREDFRALSVSAREQQMRAGYAILRHFMKEAESESTIKHILAKPFFVAMGQSVPRTAG